MNLQQLIRSPEGINHRIDAFEQVLPSALPIEGDYPVALPKERRLVSYFIANTSQAIGSFSFNVSGFVKEGYLIKNEKKTLDS